MREVARRGHKGRQLLPGFRHIQVAALLQDTPATEHAVEDSHFMRVVSRTSHLNMKSCGRFEQGVLNLDPIYLRGEDRHNLSARRVDADPKLDPSDGGFRHRAQPPNVRMRALRTT